MDAKYPRNGAQASKTSYAEKAKIGAKTPADFQNEMRKCTVIVCIDASYAKVAAGVVELAKKLHVTIVALVAGGLGRWKVVTQGEQERDRLLQEKVLLVDGRQATIIGHKPLRVLHVEPEFPIVSEEEVKECFEGHSKSKVVRMEKLRHSQLWTGIWRVYTTFEPSQKISKWQGRGFILKVEDRLMTKPMKPAAAPAVVRNEEKSNEESSEESVSEDTAAATPTEPAVTVDEGKQESKDESSEEVSKQKLDALHSPDVSDEEGELRDDRQKTKEQPPHGMCLKSLQTILPRKNPSHRWRTTNQERNTNRRRERPGKPSRP